MIKVALGFMAIILGTIGTAGYITMTTATKVAAEHANNIDAMIALMK